MKKLWFLAGLLAVICICACHNEPGIVKDDLRGSFRNRNLRSVDEAIEIANSSAMFFFGDGVSRSGKERYASDVRIVRGAFSRSSSTDTLLYVVNYADSAGFAVIAADYRIEPVFAVTEFGSYDGGRTGCPGFDMFMDMTLDYLYERVDSLPPYNPRDPNPEPPTYPGGGETVDTTGWKWVTPGGDGGGNTPQPNPGGTPYQTRENDQITWHVRIEPVIANRWDQSSPWGDYCENRVVGCGPLAVAMVLSYYELPTRITGRYDEFRNGESNGVQIQDFTLNWSRIKRFNKVDGANVITDLSQVEKLAAKNEMARLGRNIGFRSRANYIVAPNPYDNNTSTTLKENRSTLISFGLKCTSIADYSASEVSKMGSNIIIIRGATENGGHEWILDGIKRYTSVHTCYYRENDTDSWKVLSRQSSLCHYNHFNWGWGTFGVGWFNDKVFNSSYYHSLDPSSISYNGGDFKNDVKFIIVSK